MAMTMGQIIRRLRKERNFTQEELAEQLGITPQAVSRWENETGLPDISQVVPLANVFGVSVEVLFGTDGVDGKEEVRKFIMETEQKLCGGPDGISRFAHRRECCGDVQKMLEIYPNNYELLCCSLKSIVHLLWDYTEEQYADEITDKENQMKAWENEGIRQANIILNYCTDSEYLNLANRWLVSIYRIMKDYAKAEEHAKKLTNERGSQLAIVYEEMGKTEDAARQYSANIYAGFSRLEQELNGLGYLYIKQKKYEEAYACYRLYFDICDRIASEHREELPFYSTLNYDWCAAVCTCLGRYDEAMEWLEKWLENIQSAEKNHNIITTSKLPYFYGIHLESCAGSAYRLPYPVTSSLEWDSFDPIRGTDRFKGIVADAEAFENRK